jgi:hypothetical protein
VKPYPTQDRLKELFEYKDGLLIRKTKPSIRSFVGQIVGFSDSEGYLRVSVDKRQYLLHRLVYLFHHAHVPEFLDHVDGNRTNNKIENLRPATKYQNILNSKFRSDNTSGVKGVCWNTRKRKWFARIYIEKKSMCLGYYDDLELADLVVQEARVLFHKEFANHGKHCH